MFKSTIIFLLFIFIKNLHATDLNYSLILGNESFTNVSLLADAESNEQLRSLTAGVSISESSSFIQTDLTSSYSVRDYRNDIQEDRDRAELNANILWLAYPGRLEWFLSDIYTQVSINTLERDAPSNIGDANILRLGPNYFIRLNSNNTLNFEGRLVGQSFENNVNNNRITSAVRYLHGVTPFFNLSMNLESEIVKFDSPASDSDFNRYDLFLRTNYSRGASQILVELGSVNVNSSVNDDTSESRYSVLLESSRSNASDFRLQHTKNIVDRGNLIINNNQGIPGASLIDSFANDLSITTISTLGYEVNSDNVSMNINVFKQSNKGVLIQEFDNNANGVNIRTSWPATRGDLVELNINARNVNFINQPVVRKDQDRNYTLSYTYRARRNINLNYRLRSVKRQSNDDNFDFKDNRFLISVEYFSN